MIVFTIFLTIIIMILTVVVFTLWKLYDDAQTDIANLKRHQIFEQEKKEEKSMSEQKFKVGDIVECIDASNSQGKLDVGSTYTVTDYKCHTNEILLKGNTGHWYASRFIPWTKYKIGQEIFFLNIVKKQNITTAKREISVTIEENDGIVISSDSENVSVKVTKDDTFDLLVIPIKLCFESDKKRTDFAQTIFESIGAE
ncbi:MAG TPA: hypothetical protein VFV86_05035 [Nitrososphaeraceae archaeon]|nr:hypothetical protein [Nitrososphaeraceae archaeon]